MLLLLLRRYYYGADKMLLRRVIAADDDAAAPDDVIDMRQRMRATLYAITMLSIARYTLRHARQRYGEKRGGRRYHYAVTRH